MLTCEVVRTSVCVKSDLFLPVKTLCKFYHQPTIYFELGIITAHLEPNETMPTPRTTQKL